MRTMTTKSQPCPHPLFTVTSCLGRTNSCSQRTRPQSHYLVQFLNLPSSPGVAGPQPTFGRLLPPIDKYCLYELRTVQETEEILFFLKILFTASISFSKQPETQKTLRMLLLGPKLLLEPLRNSWKFKYHFVLKAWNLSWDPAIVGSW